MQISLCHVLVMSTTDISIAKQVVPAKYSSQNIILGKHLLDCDLLVN